MTQLTVSGLTLRAALKTASAFALQGSAIASLSSLYVSYKVQSELLQLTATDRYTVATVSLKAPYGNSESSDFAGLLSAAQTKMLISNLHKGDITLELIQPALKEAGVLTIDLYAKETTLQMQTGDASSYPRIKHLYTTDPATKWEDGMSLVDVSYGTSLHRNIITGASIIGARMIQTDSPQPSRPMRFYANGDGPHGRDVELWGVTMLPRVGHPEVPRLSDLFDSLQQELLP